MANLLFAYMEDVSLPSPVPRPVEKQAEAEEATTAKVGILAWPGTDSDAVYAVPGNICSAREVCSNRRP